MATATCRMSRIAIVCCPVQNAKQIVVHFGSWCISGPVTLLLMMQRGYRGADAAVAVERVSKGDRCVLIQAMSLCYHGYVSTKRKLFITRRLEGVRNVVWRMFHPSPVRPRLSFCWRHIVEQAGRIGSIRHYTS
jgi:hypothetical protein